MVGTYGSNSAPWGCSGARVMMIFGSHVGPHFANIEYFEVYEGICRYIKEFDGIRRHLKIYEGI